MTSTRPPRRPPPLATATHTPHRSQALTATFIPYHQLARIIALYVCCPYYPRARMGGIRREGTGHPHRGGMQRTLPGHTGHTPHTLL